MIRHICMFKLKEENKEEVLAEVMERTKSLASIKTTTGGVTVTNSKDAPESNYDFCLIYDFEDIEGLNAYQVDPIHVACKDYFMEHIISRACIDYEC